MVREKVSPKIFKRGGMINTKTLLLPTVGLCFGLFTAAVNSAPKLTLNELEYFEAPGVNVLAFSNPPGGMFFDSKTSGIEIIHFDERTVTNGDVRLLHTPEQWDGMGELVERKVDYDAQTIETRLHYPEHDFSYTVLATAKGDSVMLSVHLDAPLPEQLQGKAGFNLEFLPAAYFGKAYLMDDKSGIFPRHPGGSMTMTEAGLTEPTPMARGSKLAMAPTHPERNVVIQEVTGTNELMLFDGRNKAQNGWYVVRSMIPPGKAGKVIEWEVTAPGKKGWVRTPVLAHSQVGYHPDQNKRAVVELDKNAKLEKSARLLRLTAEGKHEQALKGKLSPWGRYLRYQYATFDFSEARQPGLYVIQYGDQITAPFRIDNDVHEQTWHPTLDVFFPVQMDHMRVREAYRVWHGASHLDDALQAPANYEHFDLYAHGSDTDTSFKEFEHIPGLNIGGWYDAGDYDIRTQSQYYTVQHLVHAWEQFGIDRDSTTISQEKRYTEIHRPDGKSDILQQIEHGTLALIAQHRAVGHAIPGIVAGHLYQYPHLGDGSTKTDNLVYNPELDPRSQERDVGAMYEPSTDAPTPEERVMQSDGFTSGRFDDRWAFTTNTSALNYGSAAALAAASRALRGFNDALANESIETAKRVWQFEQGREPNLYRFGNTTGEELPKETLKAAVELLLTTGEQRYADAVRQLLQQVEESFGANAFMLVLAIPHMDEDYKTRLKQLTQAYRQEIAAYEKENPFGVPITRAGWAGAGTVVGFGVANYWLHKAFPDVIEKDWVLRSLNYIFGTHPGSSRSLVSAVGTESKLVAYGSNRADFSFIPGGVVPGVLILPPDFPENKENWPFFWGQNEYVITVGSSYILLANAANQLLKRDAANNAE